MIPATIYCTLVDDGATRQVSSTYRAADDFHRAQGDRQDTREHRHGEDGLSTDGGSDKYSASVVVAVVVVLVVVVVVVSTEQIASKIAEGKQERKKQTNKGPRKEGSGLLLKSRTSFP